MTDTIVQQSYKQKQDAAVAEAVAKARKDESDRHDKKLRIMQSSWLAQSGQLSQKLNAALQANKDLEHKHAEDISLLNVAIRKAVTGASPQKGYVPS